MTNKHDIWSAEPAGEWAEGYPIGNGRLGGMVLGYPLQERVALNHDRLWRNFWSVQDHRTACDIPAFRQLVGEGRWDEAHDLLLKKIPVTSQALYVNPFVPACDLGIYPFHGSDEVSDYRRELSLDRAICTVSYQAGEVRYTREYFSSPVHGAIVIRLSASQAGRVRGEVALSRLLDPDCDVIGTSSLGEVILEGCFEEGVRFATVIRVLQRGGRLTGGRKEYLPPQGPMPGRDINGPQFIFRDKDYPHEPVGVSTCFDCADEVLLLVVTGTEDEAGADLVGWCRSRLNAIPFDFDLIRDEHLKAHQALYRRSTLELSYEDLGADSVRDFISNVREGGRMSPLLIEKMYHFGRYLAITSGRPMAAEAVAKAPINLQGLWNQDRRPPWDSDYHLDLNLQMCYWSLSMANLGELIPPVADWFLSLLPEARHMAKDLYGCRGAVWAGVCCDLRHVGNTDDLLFGWTGAGAWVCQILWHHWEYSGDLDFLRDKLYPLLKEIGLFYSDFLVEDEQGRLVPVPSASPEMGVKGRKRFSILSTPSTMDLELIREVFDHLIMASELLEVDADQRAPWSAIFSKVPLPPLDADGCLKEWMGDHDPLDVGHRHRSPLIGVCSSDRITEEDTPEESRSSRKLLVQRQSNRETICAFACVWDAQLLARYYEGDAALKELGFVTESWLIDNMLLSICDWREDAKTLNWFPGRKVFQIEASLGAVAAIAELVFQDRRGLLRLLPALPSDLSTGRMTGLRGRGGFEVSLVWACAALVEAEIISLRGEVCRVKSFTTKSALEVWLGDVRHEAIFENGVTNFCTQRGQKYVLRPKEPAL